MRKTKIVNGKICGVMVIILDQYDNLLLLQRKDNKKWEPVKGGVWKGENDKEAAIREVKEETSLDVEIKRKIAEEVNDEIIRPDGSKIKIKGTIWLGKISKRTPNIILDKKEHLNYKWIRLDSIEEVEKNLHPPIVYSMIKNL